MIQPESVAGQIPIVNDRVGSDSSSAVVSEPETCGAHKKYQPERQDIVWNTCWGVDERTLTSEAAEARGLVSFRKRWVTPETKEMLKMQLRSYVGVRQVAALLVLSAVFTMPMTIYVAQHIPSQYRTFLFIGMAIWAVAELIVVPGLYRFRRWAFWPATIIVALNMVAAIPIMNVIALAIWAAALYYLLRGTSMRFFQKTPVMA